MPSAAGPNPEPAATGVHRLVSGRLRDVSNDARALSRLSGVRYWSTTHQHWQTLIEDVYACTALHPLQHGPDFTPDEMAAGKDLSAISHRRGIRPLRSVAKTRGLTTCLSGIDSAPLSALFS